MRVNNKKTHILCIHSSQTDKIVSYIRSDESEILSGETFKILGFHFDTTPTATRHVTEVINSFYIKLWTLRFLKRSGMGAEDFLKIYKVVVKVAVEYCCIVVYHSLRHGSKVGESTSAGNEDGRNVDYDGMVRRGALETLEERRRSACLKFAQKAS